MTNLRTCACACVVALCALGGSRGAAAPQRTAALLNVSFSGDFTARERAELPLAVRRALVAAGLTVFEPEQLDLAFGTRPKGSCPDDRCRVDVARSLGAQRLVDAHFRRDAGGTGVTLVVFDAEVSAPAGTTTRFCARCDTAGMRKTVVEAARAVVAGDTAVPAGRLVVRTIPGAATVTVDGRVLGETDTDLPLAAGSHLVVLERAGATRVESRVEVKAGAVTRIELALAAVGLPSAEPGAGGVTQPARRSLRPWAYVLLGAGVVGLVAGGTLYGLGCEAEGEARRCPRLPSVRTGGLALLATGGALVAGGIVLWAFDGRRERARIAAGPGTLTLSLDWR
ncbi:MAG TPA: PEGA domain-containing protein [Polyangia bacterium]|jgi:hypothetical protein